MDDDLVREFDGARLKHIAFKAQLRTYLHQTRPGALPPVRDADRCAFGQWLERVARPRFGHLPEVRELDLVHRQVHAVVNELLDLHQSGQPEAAAAGLHQTHALTEQVLNLISTLEQKLRKEAG